MGYTMVGTAEERTLLVLHGTGNNGKSTLLKLLQAAMGDYSESLPIESLEKQKFGRSGAAASPDKIRLKGARFVSTLESEEGMPLSTKALKELCSDEAFPARGLYEGLVNVRPQYTLWLATNHRPNLPADDDAAWRRIRLIPFDSYVAPEDVDTSLDAKLHAEIPGLLVTMVRRRLPGIVTGCCSRPRPWRQRNRGGHEENDTFSEFVEMLAEQWDAGYDVDMRKQQLHEHYQRLASVHGWPSLRSNEFRERMLQRHFTETKKSPRRWEWPAVRHHIPVDYGALARAAAV